MKKALVVWILVVSGCVDAGQGEEPGGPTAGGEAAVDEPAEGSIAFLPPGGEMQGRRLLGTFADTLGSTVHFRVDTAAINRPVTLTVSGAQLVARDTSGGIAYAGADPDFVGLRLAGIGGGELKIVGASSPATGVTLYELRYRATPLDAWIDYCAGEGGAVAMQGRWTTRGLHLNGPTIAFGCEGAVAFKCTSWGYRAGAGGPGATMWDHHQACTRMARADYCANGTPHTYDLTPIVIRDFIPGAEPEYPELVHPASLPAPPDEFFFEAAWRAGEEPPVCLSKTRWASLPVGGDCGPGVTLPDPRIDQTGEFCDDMPLDRIQGAHALVINASKTNDAFLHRWVKGLDVVSTIRGYYSTQGALQQPFPGYSYVGPDGILLRNPPGSINRADLREVFQLYNPATQDRAVGYPGSIPGYMTGEFEGWTFNSSAVASGLPSRAAFTMYRAGNDYVSSIAAPTGYATVLPMSYVTSP